MTQGMCMNKFFFFYIPYHFRVFLVSIEFSVALGPVA